jgi:phage-related protein
VDADKELIWVGSSKEDLSAFTDDVKLVMGFALREAQKGGKHARAKPLKGYKRLQIIAKIFGVLTNRSPRFY